MRRILIDTGPLVALCDPSDRLHARAIAELDRLSGPLFLGLPLLTEACFLLSGAHLRRRVGALLDREVIQLGGPRNGEQAARRTLKWLERYADHAPDFADGFLVAWAESDASLAIWTFDREFSRVWKTLGGKKVRLAFD